MNSYFGGFWRMDWGLGNPNKTGALIAILMIASWGLVSVRRWGFGTALSLFTVLGICLVHTFSRGGVIAACAGIGILLWRLPKPWPMSRIVAMAAAFWMIIGASIYLEAYDRYGQGIAQTDHSITNRLDIWKTAPRMMVDAPKGWGWGNSGHAYMEWYQPIDRSEEYRTLVSSHVTWLVEFGWPLRFFYLLGWGSALLLCWPGKNTLLNGIPLGIWVAFLVGALFSSVAESPWLWLAPIGALSLAIWRRNQVAEWPSTSGWTTVGLISLLIAGSLAAIGKVESGPQISGSSKAVRMGTENAKTTPWVLINSAVMGNFYGKTLRAALEDLPSIGVALDADELPSLKDRTIVLGGHLDAQAVNQLKLNSIRDAKAILLNPDFSPRELDLDPKKVAVSFGEFSQSSWIEDWKIFLGHPPVRMEGVGDFIPDWPRWVAKLRK